MNIKNARLADEVLLLLCFGIILQRCQLHPMHECSNYFEPDVQIRNSKRQSE